LSIQVAFGTIGEHAAPPTAKLGDVGRSTCHP
jgi:hypothetical protein